MKDPLISIIIATYNSEKTLKLVLESIKKQTLPAKLVEVIIIDGGSKDKTLKIARSYKSKIINNPMTDPLNAKYLGFMNAKGRYLIGLDHDEVFANATSLERRYNIFKKDKRVKALHSSGYITPKGYHPINFYINEFGDPFSFFIYKLTKDVRFFIPSLKKRYRVFYENNEYCMFKVTLSEDRAPLMELLAGGGMVDRKYVLKELKDLVSTKELFLPHLHLHLLLKNPYLVVIKNDPLYHYSSDSLKRYLKKLEWRIRNNIYFIGTIGSAGFLKREEFEERNTNIKKFFFIPYSFSLILPFADSLWLSITRKNLFYLVHFPLVLYTSISIVYHYTRRSLGLYPILTSYDGSKKILKKWK